MSFRDLTEGLLGKATDHLGETVTYGPTASSFPVRAIFSGAERRFDEAGTPVRVARPNLGVRLSDFTVSPKIGDAVVVRSKSYKVVEVVNDGEGGATLYLRQA